MAQKPNNPDERLERMLRRWGAEQAADAAAPPPMPAARPDRPGGWMWRWLPAAAAAVFLVAGGVFFYLARHQPAGMVTLPEQEVASLRTGAARDREELAKTRGLLEKSAQEIAEKSRLADALARQYEDAQRAAAGAARLQADLTVREGELQTALAKMEVLNKQVEAGAASATELATARADLKDARTKLLAASDLATAFEKARTQTQVDLRLARDELGTLQADREKLLADLQRVYLAGEATPTKGSPLALRQAALRRNKLLDRLAAIRATDSAASAGELLDRLEAVLTKLDLLDRSDPAASAAFAALLAKGRFVEQIDTALAAAVPSDMRTWLLEARLILMGADHVG
jgi:hypothetical protein